MKKEYFGAILKENSKQVGDMRHLRGYIPEYPVGTAQEIARMIADFVPVARAVIGVKNLKIITFGPRPQDFFACNAPIKGLYELGVEVEENSELDLLVSYKAHAYWRWPPALPRHGCCRHPEGCLRTRSARPHPSQRSTPRDPTRAPPSRHLRL